MMLMLTSFVVKAQKVGYEMRTNERSYFCASYDHFELRHRTDLKENRVTYRHKTNLTEHFILSIPLHYKIECHIPTLEPRFIYKWDNKALWIQQEFGLNEWYNYAVALDFNKGNYYYRVGWDNSNTYRFRVSIKLN